MREPRPDSRRRRRRRRIPRRPRPRPGKAADGADTGFEWVNAVADRPAWILDRLERGLARVALGVFYALVVLLVLTVLWIAGGVGVVLWRGHRAAPLLQAVRDGDVDRVHALVEAGADVNLSGLKGTKPLEVAVERGDGEIARLLLAGGAEPSPRALGLAVMYGHTDLARALIEAGGDPNLRNDWDRQSLLEGAAEAGDVEFARVLLQHGADPNDTDPLPTPALHQAAAQGDEALVRLLLEHNADAGLRWHGRTAAQVAMEQGHSSIARTLTTREEDRDGAGQPE